MTKLEQKLIELGYVKKSSHLYMKYILLDVKASIHLNKINNMILNYTLTWNSNCNFKEINELFEKYLEVLNND